MIYLDYSATTKTDDKVLDTFVKCSKDFIGNPNSLHKLGVESKNIIDKSTEQVKNILNIDDYDVIYTSGSSESNNLAIKGICEKYKNRGMHIITTSLEHSSIYGPIDYLVDQGFTVDFVDLDENGLVDLNDLKYKITEDTILVTINAVNSEIGLLQPIKEISKIVRKHPKCFFHCDMTQAIGKVKIDVNDCDLASFSAHKFFGIKGIGVLLKKKKINITPLIHGGKSTTVYRSGTPCLPLIVSLARALRLALTDLDKKYNDIKVLNKKVKDELSKYKNVRINSNDSCIPHILNISVLGVKPETMLHALEKYEIYISTQSACSSNTTVSKAVMSLTKNKERASSSIRISLSYKTTKEEITEFLEKFDKCYRKLVNLR